ncbi:hypothetical protein AAVH_37163 [Aphelenchoides avenae]|nr:hypothetical protein AAVH_37163 [Aphelenchus avenae]
MHPILMYESLFFCPRDDLERLQPLSSSLLDIIVKGSKVLPLRPIGIVCMASKTDKPNDTIRICLKVRGIGDARGPDYEASMDDGDVAETFLRLQNTCINFIWAGIRDSAFLRYWRAQETACFTVVEIGLIGLKADYDVIDSIMNHLRPRAMVVHAQGSSWRENGNYDETLHLLDRDSFLNSLQICRLEVSWDAAFPPPSFILKEPGYPNYRIWCGGSQVAGGIDDFIESFVRDGCANKKLQSVCILWEVDENELSPALKQLKKSTKIDAPLPKNDLRSWYISRVRRETQCEMQAFVNTMQWKRMVVYKWAVEYVNALGLHTAHFLQCRVESL